MPARGRGSVEALLSHRMFGHGGTGCVPWPKIVSTQPWEVCHVR